MQTLVQWLASSGTALDEKVRGDAIALGMLASTPKRSRVRACMSWWVDWTAIANLVSDKLVDAGWTDENFESKTEDDIPDTVVGWVSTYRVGWRNISLHFFICSLFNHFCSLSTADSKYGCESWFKICSQMMYFCRICTLLWQWTVAEHDAPWGTVGAQYIFVFEENYQ